MFEEHLLRLRSSKILPDVLGLHHLLRQPDLRHICGQPLMSRVPQRRPGGHAPAAEVRGRVPGAPRLAGRVLRDQGRVLRSSPLQDGQKRLQAVRGAAGELLLTEVITLTPVSLVSTGSTSQAMSTTPASACASGSSGDRTPSRPGRACGTASWVAGSPRATGSRRRLSRHGPVKTGSNDKFQFSHLILVTPARH